MVIDLKHLHPITRPVATAPVKERLLDLTKPKWIGYPVAKRALNRLEELIALPQSHRMPNLIICGPTNNGKTMIVERFLKSHPANDAPELDASNIPVLSVQMPISPEPRRFYCAVLYALNASFRSTDTIANLETQALKLLNACGVKMLIIDELHNMLSGRNDHQRQFLNLLRYIGNDLKIPIVALGIQSALRGIQIDEQLANRFEPLILPKWHSGKEFLMLLNSIESVLPLTKPSSLASTENSEMILAKTEGTIGEIMLLLRAAAKRAIQSEQEYIDVRALNECGYVSPADRRNAIKVSG